IAAAASSGSSRSTAACAATSTPASASSTEGTSNGLADVQEEEEGDAGPDAAPLRSADEPPARVPALRRLSDRRPVDAVDVQRRRPGHLADAAAAPWQRGHLPSHQR